MLELALIVVFGIYAVRSTTVREEELSEFPRKISDWIGGLWDIAHQGMRQNRFLRAEKALLTILKIDEKNAAAYNRLGILYAKQREYRDAIDCFEIASSIEPSASSLHNLGLIYYETENYEKAAVAFEMALKYEHDMAARHVAYAKVQEKMNNVKLMVKELETAVDIEPSRESYSLLLKAYENNGYAQEADILRQKLRKMAAKAKPQVRQKILRRRRVVI